RASASDTATCIQALSLAASRRRAVADDADDLAAEHAAARRHRQLRDDARAVCGHLVLHLHRLDDADDAAGRNLVAVADPDLEHRALHRAHDPLGAAPAA